MGSNRVDKDVHLVGGKVAFPDFSDGIFVHFHLKPDLSAHFDPKNAKIRDGNSTKQAWQTIKLISSCQTVTQANLNQLEKPSRKILKRH